MISYIIKMIVTMSFSGFTIFLYYKIFNFHLEAYSLKSIFTYLVPLFVIYLIYKVLSFYVFNDSKNKKIEISYIGMLACAIIHLLLICIIYFTSKQGFSGAQGIALFIKIIGFLFLPIFIFTASYGFGNKILSYIKGFQQEENTFKLLSSLGFGFFSFIFLTYIFAFFGLYNLIFVFATLIIFSALGYKPIKQLYYDFITKKATVENNIYLYTSEFLFVILTALISVNLIMVFRPFPIGWDDLGVYMNYPNLIANAGKLLSLGGLQAWELYTGIGYLFSSGTQAFFLNSFSGIIGALILYKFIDDFLGKKNDFINIGLLIVAIFLAMPMNIFQLAKDMKLDIGLFSFSMISIYILYYIFIKKEDFIGEKNESIDKSINLGFRKNIKKFFEKYKLKKEFIKKEDLIYLFVAGALVGFAFAIKMTSLMLFSAAIGLIIFNRIGFSAFLGYLAIYFGVFTKLQLWDMMNVVYPKGSTDFINMFFISSILIGILLLIFSFIRHKKEYFLKSFYIVLIFIAGFFIALSPWMIKNISEVGNSKIEMGNIIGGKYYNYTPDFSKLYSSQDLKLIEEKVKKRSALDENGQASNADLGRYFGYEQGINNYLKLPFNLSMQKNQRGEYTDITYIFFALIPVLFLFIPLKNRWFYLGIYAFLIFEIMYFLLPGSGVYLTNIFNNLELPAGYAFILGIYLLILMFFKYATNRQNDNILKLFIVNLSFSIFYIFLWNISAFGIVWYGIVMYFSFFIFIGIGVYYIICDDKKIDSNEQFYMLKTINFLFVFFIIALYFVRSSIPHMFANFNEDSYMHYKVGNLNGVSLKENDAIFTYHSDYLKILFELNIKDDKKQEFIDKVKTEIINYFKKNSFQKELIDPVKNIDNIESLNNLFNYFLYGSDLQSIIKNYIGFKSEIEKIRTNMYNKILFPNEKQKSDAIIYRMGTFLKYFITENNYRLYDDSLAFIFDDYIYNAAGINKTVDNFKKLGFSYILVDLNTPTIDNDPSHALTIRFENLLKIFIADKLELIDTDSYCLRTGLEIYNKSQKSKSDLDNYVLMAGVNFESYDKSDKQINRGQKLISCYDKIINLFDEKSVNENNFPYLLGFYNEYKTQNFAKQEHKYAFLAQRFQTGSKILLKIK